MNPLTAALVAMRRSPYQTFAAILTVSITFFVGYVFSLSLLGAEQLLKYFETRPQIIAFFELKTTPQTIATVEQAIKTKPYVDTVTIVSKEKALDIYQEGNSDKPLLLELVTADILPASIEVSGKQVADLPQIKQDLEAQTGVEEVAYQEDLVDSMTNWANALRTVAVVSICLLSLTSFLTMLVIIGMKVTTKKQVIHIMRIIGATRWYITVPFLYEGLLYGLIGSLIGWSGMVLGLLYVIPTLQNFLREIPLFPIPYEVLAIQLGIGTAVGMLFGGFTGVLAVRRMIRR